MDWRLDASDGLQIARVALLDDVPGLVHAFSTRGPAAAPLDVGLADAGDRRPRERFCRAAGFQRVDPVLVRQVHGSLVVDAAVAAAATLPPEADGLVATAKQHATPLTAELSSVEDSVYQTKSRSGQDPLNYPIRLNNKIGALLGVAGSSAGRPTAQVYEVYRELDAELEAELRRMQVAITRHLVPLNATLKAAGLPEIVPKAVDVPAPRQPAVIP